MEFEEIRYNLSKKQKEIEEKIKDNKFLLHEIEKFNKAKAKNYIVFNNDGTVNKACPDIVGALAEIMEDPYCEILSGMKIEELNRRYQQELKRYEELRDLDKRKIKAEISELEEVMTLLEEVIEKIDKILKIA